MPRMTEVKIKFISLVTKAANKKKFAIIKSENGTIEIDSFIFKQDEDKRLITSIVYEPDVKDTQGDYMTAEDIEKAAHDFMTTYGEGADIQHDDKKANVDIVESWVAKTDTTIGGQFIKKGTWVATAKVNDDEIWDAVKKGRITGFSMGGLATKINKNDDTEDKGMEEIRKMLEEIIKKGASDKAIDDLIKRIEKAEEAISASAAETEIQKSEKLKKDEEIKELKETIKKMDEAFKQWSAPTSTEESIEKAEAQYSENIRKAATLATGAAIVPTPLANQMIKDMKEYSPFFKYGTHIKATGTTITVPVRLPNIVTSAKAKKEGEAVANGSINLKKISLSKGVVQSNIPITDELRKDTMFNIGAIVREYSVEDIGEYIAANTVRGVVNAENPDAPNRIEGFQTSADFKARTVAMAVDKAPTYAELLEVKKQVKPQYRRNAKWYISPDAEIWMKTLKDGEGRHLWQTSTSEGTPDKFDGNPVEVMWSMGGAAGDIEILFADFAKLYYYFVDYEMESETERQGKTAVTDEILRSRIGGKIANHFAGYGLKNATPAGRTAASMGA